VYGADVALEPEPPARAGYRALFGRGYLPKVVFIGVIWMCQAVPMFAIYTFGPQLMRDLGFDAHQTATLGELVIGTFFLIGCIPAMFWADSLGRRRLLVLSFGAMTLALAVLGALPAAGALVTVLCLGAYAFFSGGPGNLQWLYPNELFPTDIRASAVGAAMALSRIGTVVSTSVLPAVLADHGPRAVLVAGAVISAVGLAASALLAPETRGLTLAQTSVLPLHRRRSRTP
jgi:putative MFS transporter